MKRKKLILILALLLFGLPQAANAEGLTLEQAYSLSLQHNPNIQVYRARYMAAEGNRLQQSLGPNPEAFFEAENFAGDSPRSGFDAAEYTLGVEQQIEMAGKRSKREQIADFGKEQARQEALAGIQAILARTKAAYMRVAIAKERLSLAEKRVALADKTHITVKARIEAAKSADIEHTKADIEASAADVEKRRAERELLTAQMTLANLMGATALNQPVTADITVLPVIPEQEAIMQALGNTPMSVLSQVAIMQQQAALDLAQANGVPDPTFGLGVRHYAEDDGSAFLASVSIPIPVSNRNQGAIAEAKANLRAAQADQEAQRLALIKQAMELLQTLASAKEEVLAYQDGILPSARQAFTQAEEGFDRGAFSFLDLLDAQRTLFDVQEKHLEALAAFHETKAQVDMLTGAYASAALAAFDQNKNAKE